MFTIQNRQGQIVANAETFTSAMRLVDFHQRSDGANGPFRALPVRETVAAPAKRLSLTERFFGFFGITD